MSPNASAQIESMRFELGRRLTRFEKAWETGDSQRRAACVETMEVAVKSFFGLQLDTAAQSLDRATQNVLGEPEATTLLWLAANRYSIDFETSWIDSKGGPLRFRLRRLAGATSSTKRIEPLVGNLQMSLQDGSTPMATMEWSDVIPLSENKTSSETESQEPGLEPEQWYTWDLPALPPGDYQVSAACAIADGKYDLIAERISVSIDLQSRLQKAQAWYEENRKGKGDTIVSTMRWLARELRQGFKGEPTEIDIPWNAWLSDFEALRDSGGDHLKSMVREPNAGASQRSCWLQLNNGEKTQIVRLGIPKPPRSRLPVLFAFHGAGGSENMFFEAYGAGRLVNLANDRGWLVVSPRQSFSGLGMDIREILDELEKWFPIDRDQVMLAGHSMGAAQAVNQVSIHPKEVKAVAALGGGGMPRSSLRSNPVPFFVAAGDRDFGRPRAKSLAESLRNLNCNVDYRDYPNVEHMVIVQAALDDVFAFLDDYAKNPNSTSAVGK